MEPYYTWLGRKVPINSSAETFATWFGRVVWVGVAANVLLSLPAFFATQAFVEYAVGPYEQVTTSSAPLLWPRFAALLLVLLSLFYIPAAIDPYRYRASAWLAVLARFAGAAFFLPQHYVAFGLFDLGFGVVEGLLLLLAVRAERTEAMKSMP